MPRYDYACQKCGHHFEAQQKISEDPLKTCPNCREDALERLVSRTSFALKGSGWYADGYGAGSSSSSSSPSTPPTSPTPKTASSETKTEAKPAEAPAKPAAEKSSKDSGD
jgi:putative FmdB family regulatory protein